MARLDRVRLGMIRLDRVRLGMVRLISPTSLHSFSLVFSHFSPKK